MAQLLVRLGPAEVAQLGGARAQVELAQALDPGVELRPVADLVAERGEEAVAAQVREARDRMGAAVARIGRRDALLEREVVRAAVRRLGNLGRQRRAGAREQRERRDREPPAQPKVHCARAPPPSRFCMLSVQP